MPGRLHLLAALLLLSVASPAATAQPAPACLDVLAAKVAADGALQLSWTRVAGATGYEVRARYPTEPWTVLVRWLPPDTTAFALRPSVLGREYQVLALQPSGSSTATCPVMAMAPASAGPALAQAAQAAPLVGVGLLAAAAVLGARHWSARRAVAQPPMSPVVFQRVRADAAARAPPIAPLPQLAPRAKLPARTPPRRRAAARSPRAPAPASARRRKAVSRPSGNR